MWAPDKSRAQCTRCGNEFVWHRRRHHCRCCGGLFCDACTDHYVPVTNPIAQPGIFSSMVADKNSGVQRVCFGCFHKFYAYICVYPGFFGSSNTEVCNTIEDAEKYMDGVKEGLIVHVGTAKIISNKNPNDPASTAKMLERAKGKARKIMGETFYEDQSAANRPILAPTIGQHLFANGSNKKNTGNDDDDNYSNSNKKNQQQNNNNNTTTSAATTTFGSNPNASNRTTNNNTNNNTASPPSQKSTSTASSSQVPLPQFCYVVCICLDNGARRLRFLQPDVHADKARLVLDVQKLATEEFDAHGKFVDQTSFVEAVVLLDTNWKTPLFVGTARFFYRDQPYIDSTIEQVMKTERFVICAHRGGKAQCDLVMGGADARQKLFDCANGDISSVIVAASGEPIGHTCRDVSWRRDLVDRADSDGIKLLHDGQARVAFVASTVVSAHADVRISQTLWDLEQCTCGQIRTTVQAWAWDPKSMDKKCIAAPFLGGAVAPPCVTPGQMDQVASAIRKIAVGSKSAAPVPENNNNNNSNGGVAAFSGSNNSNNNNNTINNNNNRNNQESQQQQQQQQQPLHLNKLSVAPPRPGVGGATAAASLQEQNAANARSASVSQAPECPVCMDEFNAGSNKPLVLPCCGHSICAKCVQELMERKASNATSVPCPRCREEISVSQKLVPNRTLLEQIS